MIPSRWLPHVSAVAGYAAAAVVLTWPLTLHLGTHLTGPIGGDTGVYVWNQWVFQHELLDHRTLPYFTSTIFSLTSGANLGLHNYTTFQNLLALPLVRTLGVVYTFNLIYLLMTVLTGYMTFLLVRHVTGRSMESWLAGLAFAWSPVLVTRGMGHFSVAAAAPLAAFMLVLLRTGERERLRDAVLLGVTVWWAASTDVYFAIYCVLIAAVYLGTRTITLERRPAPARAVPWALDVMALCIAGLVAALLISGGWQFTFLGRVARVHSLYTPVLILTTLAVARLLWPYRTRLVDVTSVHAWRVFRLATVAALLAAALLSPVLYAVGVRIAENRFDAQRTLWRSSPSGIDLLAFVLPNPNHPLTPDAVRAWLSPRPDAYLENVASIPLVILAALAIAWRRGWRVPRLWMVMVAAFGLFALGPFIQIAGVNTHVPGPWAFLRYAPIVGLARTPGRFSVVVMLLLAVLFGCALVWLGSRAPSRRRLILSAVAPLLVFELLPLPRTLYPAVPPRIYRHVAAAPADARVLELPFGVRDGTSSVGNFTARSQFYQTYHHKALIGGYLSRVSRRRIAEIRRYEMLDALITLSEGKSIDAARHERLLRDGRAFVAAARVSYVVMDLAGVTPALRDFAIRAFDLRYVERAGDVELYRTP